MSAIKTQLIVKLSQVLGFFDHFGLLSFNLIDESKVESNKWLKVSDTRVFAEQIDWRVQSDTDKQA